MGTEGNALVANGSESSAGNAHLDKDVIDESVSGPTTDSNGDATVSFTTVRVLQGVEDVEKVTITGSYRAQVQSVNGNDVDVRITEPDGGGNFQNVTGTTVTGETLDVSVQA